MGAWIETASAAWVASFRARSHPTWVRGLKPSCAVCFDRLAVVAPYVGAWIETNLSFVGINLLQVAPYVGAWIETRNKSGCKGSFQVAPYVGAWIETHLFTIP